MLRRGQAAGMPAGCGQTRRRSPVAAALAAIADDGARPRAWRWPSASSRCGGARAGGLAQLYAGEVRPSPAELDGVLGRSAGRARRMRRARSTRRPSAGRRSGDARRLIAARAGARRARDGAYPRRRALYRPFAEQRRAGADLAWFAPSAARLLLAGDRRAPAARWLAADRTAARRRAGRAVGAWLVAVGWRGARDAGRRRRRSPPGRGGHGARRRGGDAAAARACWRCSTGSARSADAAVGERWPARARGEPAAGRSGAACDAAAADRRPRRDGAATPWSRSASRRPAQPSALAHRRASRPARRRPGPRGARSSRSRRRSPSASEPAGRRAIDDSDCGERQLETLPRDDGGRARRRRQHARRLPPRPRRLRGLPAPARRRAGRPPTARPIARPISRQLAKARPAAAHRGAAALGDPPVLSLSLSRRPRAATIRPRASTARSSGRPLPKLLDEDEVEAPDRGRRRAPRTARGRCACWRCSSCSTPPGLRVSELVGAAAVRARGATAASLIVRGKGGKERMVPIGRAGARGARRLSRASRDQFLRRTRPKAVALAVPVARRAAAISPASASASC